MRPRLRDLIGVAVSVLLIWWTLRDVSPGEVWAVVRTGNVWLLGAAVFVATAGFFVRALRWRILLHPLKADTGLGNRFGAVTIGFMANNLLPARMGEIVRALAIGRMERISASGALGSLVVERLLDGIVLLAMLVVPFVLPGFPLEAVEGGVVARLVQGALVVLLGICAFLAVLVAWPAWAMRVAERVVGRLPEAARGRGRAAVQAFIGSLEVLRRPGLLLPAALWTGGFWMWHAWSFHLGMAAFGIREGFGAAVFTAAAVGFWVALPSAPGFVGTFHGGADWAIHTVYGVDSARSLAFAYGYHLGGFFPVTLIGLWYARRIGLSLRQMSRAPAATTPGDL